MRFVTDAGITEISSLRLFGSVASLLLWIQIIFWLRLFDGTAQYVSLVMRTINAITSFMIVLAMMLFAFGTSLYILNINRIYRGQGEDDLVFPFAQGDNIFLTSLLAQYSIALGDFNVSLDD